METELQEELTFCGMDMGVGLRVNLRKESGKED